MGSKTPLHSRTVFFCIIQHYHLVLRPLATYAIASLGVAYMHVYVNISVCII